MEPGSQPESADHGCAQAQPDGPVSGNVSREHWIVPVHGLSGAGPDGTVQAIARRDGTVVLDLTCGGSQTRVRFDVCQAAQLATGIWEAAGTAQQFTVHLDDDQPPPPPPDGAADLPEAWREHLRRNTPQFFLEFSEDRGA